LPDSTVAYTADKFRREVRENGFEVQRLVEAVRHFAVQAWLSHSFGPRLPRFTRALVEALEWMPTANPLEWVEVCRKLS
jgi:hypothetical protein